MFSFNLISGMGISLNFQWIWILTPTFLELISARNLITLETCHQCKSGNKNSWPIDFSTVIFSSFNNTISFNGSFSVVTNINGIINLELETTRCKMLHKQCQKFSKVKFDDICGKFFNSKVLGDRFVSAVKPKLECPFKKGVYHTENVVLDLEFAAKLPFDGW